jgi:hypothetical protein
MELNRHLVPSSGGYAQRHPKLYRPKKNKRVDTFQKKIPHHKMRRGIFQL